MTEQLALFGLPPEPVIKLSFSDSDIDTEGHDPSWDDPLPKSSTEKIDEPGKFNCGDRVAIAGGDRIGTTGTIVDIDGRWVSVEFDAGKTEVLPEVELVPGQESIEATFNVEPPDPDDFPDLDCYERAWKQWESSPGNQAVVEIELDDRVRFLGRYVGVCVGVDSRGLLTIRTDTGETFRGITKTNIDEILPPQKFQKGDRVFSRVRGSGVVREYEGGLVRFALEDKDHAILIEEHPLIRSPEEPIRRSKTRSQVSGWIEFEEKVYEGKRKTSTYRYFYYRYEAWRDGKLLRTPAKRLSMSQLELVSRCLEESFSVDEILKRLKLHTKSLDDK